MKMLSRYERIAKAALAPEESNPFLRALCAVPSVQELCWVVYSEPMAA